MGATGWGYFVPYQTDILAALQELRKVVFEQGNYFSGGVTKADYEAGLKACGAESNSVTETLARQASNMEIPEQTRKRFAELLQQVREFNDTASPRSKPTSIEELLARQGETGTRSILDVTRISSTPEFGTVSPLPTPELREIFETEKPARAEVEKKYQEGALEKFVSVRWQGIYIVAYRGNAPAEIFFAGCSGD